MEVNLDTDVDFEHAGRRYGWKPSAPDRHDRVLRFSPFLHAQLPATHSLRGKMPPVRHQLHLGSCTAKVVSALVGYRELTDEAPRLIEPSSLFQYYNTRVLEKTTSFDSGASLRNAILALQQYGVCDNACWPYHPDRFKDRPPEACYEQARKYLHVEAHRVEQSLGGLKSAIFTGDPVAFGFTVFSAFENPSTARTGVVNLPGPGEKVLGGHAVLLVGYDDSEARFTCRNSYGAGWGDGGYFTIPYPYVLNPELADDFWTFTAFK